MKHKDYKPDGGKLLRVDYEIKDNVIINIKINGDFFIHPENAIDLIEETLKGKNIDVALAEAQKLIKKEDIIVIGFSIWDLKSILSNTI